MPSVIVPPDMDGQRLDQALALLLPEAGLRERRRLVEDGRVLLDGRVRAKGCKVAAGQVLELAEAATRSAPDGVPPEHGARLLGLQGEWAVFFKPAGLHSAALAGRDNPSLEALLPELLPGRKAVLLNRLDQPTSGIVLAALTPGAAQRYAELEDARRVTKEYAVVVNGCLEWPVMVKNALDTADCKKTKVLPVEDDDPLRWTRAEPLGFDEAAGRTRLRAIIRKGARHQIRAHLGHIGHPIVGDALYGAGEGGILYLHHRRLRLPGLDALVEPDWPEMGPWDRE